MQLNYNSLEVAGFWQEKLEISFWIAEHLNLGGNIEQKKMKFPDSDADFGGK